jgi:hypothetical protein
MFEAKAKCNPFFSLTQKQLTIAADASQTAFGIGLIKYALM